MVAYAGIVICYLCPVHGCIFHTEDLRAKGTVDRPFAARHPALRTSSLDGTGFGSSATATSTSAAPPKTGSPRAARRSQPR